MAGGWEGDTEWYISCKNVNRSKKIGVFYMSILLGQLYVYYDTIKLKKTCDFERLLSDLHKTSNRRYRKIVIRLLRLPTIHKD